MTSGSRMEYQWIQIRRGGSVIGGEKRFRGKKNIFHSVCELEGKKFGAEG